MKAAWESWNKGQCQIIKERMTQGDSKKAYQIVKPFTKSGQHKTSVIKVSNGRLLTESIRVLLYLTMID